MRGRAALKALPILGVLLYLYSLLERPEIAIVGSFTQDVIVRSSRAGGHTIRPGGAVSYASVAAKALGLKACVLTVAGPDVREDLKSLFEGQELHVVPANSTLTFEHSYNWKGDRQLRVAADPHVTLTRSHLPWHCRRARVVLLGPLMPDDVNAASFLEHDSWLDLLVRGPQLVGVIGQGYQRVLGVNGRVLPLDHPAPQLLERHGKRTSLFLSDVETRGWTAEQLATVAAQHGRMLITQGEHGAQEWNSSGVSHQPIVPVIPVDTNGAGDTFATGYMIALAQGHPNPGHAAAWVASRAVMAPQSCKPGCAGDAMRGHRIGGVGLGNASNALSEPLAPAPSGGAASVAEEHGAGPRGPAWLSASPWRPWSTAEKIWSDLVALWPHTIAVLYDALMGSGAHHGSSSSSGVQPPVQPPQPGAWHSGDSSASEQGDTCRSGLGSFRMLGSHGASYIDRAHRWAAGACCAMHGLHQHLCSVTGANTSQAGGATVDDRNSCEWSSSSSGSGCWGHANQGHLWQPAQGEQGAGAGGQQGLLSSALHRVRALVVQSYCGGVWVFRKAGLILLETGLSVAMRVSSAVDEVMQPRMV